MAGMPAATMETSAERLDKDRVKMRVEVPETALVPAIDAVYRRWAKEIKVPGFRKGKVPRPLIDARVGPGAVREEALRDALPEFYREALRAEELEAIAPPDIEVVEFEEGSPLVFEVTVDVRPDIELPDLTAIKVEAPSPEVTDEDIDEQLERLRDRFAELETVGRDARRGDFVLIDLKGYRHDEAIEGASASDLLYEIGSRTGPPKLDEELEGSRPGAILKFSDVLPQGELAGQDISFTVLVKEVKTKKLAPLDDEFAKTAGEFDSLDELKEDLRARLGDVKAQLVQEELRRRVLTAFVEASPLEPPEKLVEAEFKHRLEHIEADLAEAGLTLDQYAETGGETELEMRRDIRIDATASVKAELLLEELARTEKLQLEDEDVGREIAMLAARAEQDPKEVAQQLVRSDQLGALVADVLRRKALDYVVKHVDVEGNLPMSNSGS
ncbi:MAG: trigger factor [Actinomycetota bacterium]|jgi:trigger factor|nr:trigger factor [Actinomycetota bacterium]